MIESSKHIASITHEQLRRMSSEPQIDLGAEIKDQLRIATSALKPLNQRIVTAAGNSEASSAREELREMEVAFRIFSDLVFRAFGSEEMDRIINEASK